MSVLRRTAAELWGWTSFLASMSWMAGIPPNGEHWYASSGRAACALWPLESTEVRSFTAISVKFVFEPSSRSDSLITMRSTDLRSRTHGRATYSMHFDRYEQAPGNVSEEVVARMQGK